MLCQVWEHPLLTFLAFRAAPSAGASASVNVAKGESAARL